MTNDDGLKLKDYIFENRVNVVHFEKALEVSRSSVYDWYKLDRIPTSTKKAIADALGAKLTDVWPYTTVEAMENHRPTQAPTDTPDAQVDELIAMVEALTAIMEGMEARLKKLETQALRKRPTMLR